MTDLLSIVRRGNPFKGAKMGNTIFGFKGCKITLHGIAAERLGQNPNAMQFWIYEDDDNWLLVDGKTREVTCRGRATCINNNIAFDEMTGTIEWE